MIEMLVGGFLLTGTVCILDGEEQRACREIPAITFGNKYACDNRMESILESFPHVKPERLGYAEDERLTVHVRCRPANGKA